ncbi:MAG: phosphate signaling complex PhoU family protein [Chloroflexia bacterium]
MNLRMGDQALIKPPVDIPLMAQKSVDMLHRALTAFTQEDVEAARALPLEDNEVDALYDQVYRELMTYVLQDPRAIAQANWLLWVAHDLERVGDRVTNLCEQILYIATGEMTELDTSDDEWGGAT